MDLNNALQTYFRGEKNLGMALAFVGAFALAAAFWTWRTQPGQFGAWLAASATVAALALAALGVGLTLKTDGQVATLVERLTASQPSALTEEIARMEKVNQLWPRAKAAWAIASLVAFVLLLVLKSDWASALGLTILFLTTSLFFVDVFGERRAHVYMAALQQAQSAR